MGDYECAKCSKVFVQKGHYERHLARKIPCKLPIVKRVIEKEFREVSEQLNAKLEKTYRQDNGIFFTPISARKRLFEVLDKIKCKPKTILEPSFGSGEFLLDLYAKYPKATVYGVEKDSELFGSVEKTDMLFNEDFLNFKDCSVDLIVGNPPYFNVSIKKPECMIGHGNIYILFIYKCLVEHLNKNGVLAFVIPTSLYNSSYYEPCRKYIAENTTILHVENLKVSYFETAQKTMLLVLKNGKKNDDFLFKRGGNVYITPFFKELNSLVENTTTLDELGFKIKTGEVVWNQEKEHLSSKGGVLVIYTTNIVDNQIVLDNLSGEKKQYIKQFRRPPIKGPAILISRGYGNNYRFSYAFVDDDVEFYGENHINVVSDGIDFQRVLNSFKDKKTAEFIRYFVGNGALSNTELKHVLPIF